ncbi:VOC family protein [Gemmata sp.]|uniref:VOC family protein n=1 Tax=Gemmata sp. TaxID=1914242 RepID=UPI003F703E8A
MHVQPYLNFNGRCEEALTFYREALGAEVTALMRFGESPEPCPGMPAGTENKVMHSALKIGESTVMASDCECRGAPNFQGVSLALSPATTAAAEKAFAALAAGGQVHMPLGPTFWSPCFGVVADKFGVSWMVSVPA